MAPSGNVLSVLTFLCLAVLVPWSNAASQEPLGSSAASNDSLLWGPYRPNLYFGVRPRIPKSLLTGLLWTNVDNFATVQHNFRYTCEQHEGFAGYGWEEYDLRNGGKQVIHDAGNKIDITTEFVKIPGGSHGGNWAVRVKGTPRDDAPANLITSLFFYAGMEGIGELGFSNVPSEKGDATVTLHGQTNELGKFAIDITGHADNKLPYKNHPSFDLKPLDRPLAQSIPVPQEALWAAKNVILAVMNKQIEAYVKEFGEEDMPPPWQTYTIENDITSNGNLQVVQKILVGAFEFDVLFNSASASKRINSASVTGAIGTNSKNFHSRYQEVLKPAAPFNSKQYEKFAESMFSNLYGGVGYFYGDSVTDRSYAPEYEEDNEGFWEETEAARARNQITRDPEHELFTSVPSRPFFPRGFLWDEGFHLIPIADWDLDVTFEIVDSWFKLIDEDGWIAREQILGAEARSKVPQEFQVQYPHYANPPTLFLTVELLVEKLENKALPAEYVSKVKTQLESLYPLLKRNYFWYRKTQTGDIKSYDREASSTKEAYRWRGRTPRHILPSGLDDYPRPQPPHPGELHVDLISWMGMASRSLRRLANLLSETDDETQFANYEKAIARNIDDLHWSKKDKTYCDASIDDYEESYHVCHKGYISIFPFMTGMLSPTHPNLKHILDLISSPDHLWSPYGIRSLSKLDEFYGTDENYWRSPIWINMNYLIIKNLLAVATNDESPSAIKEQARKIYVDLRKNVVQTVYDNWERTGFAWEQYNPETGEGQRTQHFTGWTSLVCVIMKMPDLSKGSISHGEL